MGSFFFTSASGWIASILLSLEILLPYLLRPTRLSGPLDLPRSYAKPYLRRLWPHYWAGYLLLALSVTHAWIPMQASGYLKRANIFGLWFATAALSLLLLQVTLGLLLQDSRLQTRERIRGWHYWIMLALTFSVAIHIWLNS